ncbi:hypothetical protein BGZ46_004774, partial [Entomortierella lignicola]
MKFSVFSVASLALFASMASAQSNSSNSDACTSCLQTNLLALPLCKGLNITIGSFNPGESPAFAVCLCSSLNGTWIDGCQDASQCGPDILQFKTSYASGLEQAGLQCNGSQPTFVPGPTATIDPTTSLGSPTGSGASSTGKTSFGVKEAVPSALFKQVMGLTAVFMAIGASL